MTIRPAMPSDLPAIVAIWNRVIRETDLTFTTTEKTADTLSAAQFLVSESTQIHGFATYAPFRPGPGYAHTGELSIYLAPTAQRRGLGAALLEALEHQAKVEGMHSLIAGIAGQNAPAIAFHAAQGYAPVGHLPEVGWKNGTWHDLILMQKRL